MKQNKLFLCAGALLMALSLASCGGSETPVGPTEKKYTYNAYLGASPKSWNVHTWEENTDSYIQSFTETGLYDCIYDLKADGKEGYKFVTEMAASFPQPVEADQIADEDYELYDYLGNIPDGSVWDIELNKNAVFENGEKITAETYVQSMERLLNPKMINRRADSFYAGSLVLANAERYFKQARETQTPAYKFYVNATSDNPTDANFANDGIYYLNVGAYTDYAESIFANLEPSSANFYTVLENRSQRAEDKVELAAQRIMDASKYYNFYYVEHSAANEDWKKILEEGDFNAVNKADLLDHYIDIMEFDEREVFVRTKVDSSVKLDKEETFEQYSYDALVKDLKTFTYAIGNGRGASGKEWRYKLPLFGMFYNDDELGFEKVGIKALDEYKIRLYLAKPITELDLKFALSSNWIVNLNKYDALTQDLGGLKKTRWATDKAENYVSYGPYKLTYFKTDDSFRMTKNEAWYGYSDGQHENQFQMTDVQVRIIKQHQSVKEEFKKGLLDEFQLERSDMPELGNSSRIQYTPESYTTKISFNSERSKLAERESKGVSKTLLANKDFRKGISLIINRRDLIKFTTAGQAYPYLLNSLYLTDVEKGEAYRSTPQAQSVYGKVYNTLGGDNGGEVLAEDKIGYNYQYGVNLMKKAYQEELAHEGENYIKPGERMEIEFRVFDDESEVTKDLYTYLNNLFQKAGKDIGLDLSVTLEKDEDYYNSAKRGNYDMIFSTWGGAAIAPWNLMQVYLDKNFDGNCEFGFKGQQDKETLEIDVNGDGKIDEKEEVKSYHAWYEFLIDTHTEVIKNSSMTQEEFESAYAVRHNERLNILSGLEAAIINRFQAIPLYSRNSADIMSFKVDNITSTYINLIGYGGIRFMKFNYTDAEWKSAISSGKISYDSYKN